MPMFNGSFGQQGYKADMSDDFQQRHFDKIQSVDQGQQKLDQNNQFNQGRLGLEQQRINADIAKPLSFSEEMKGIKDRWTERYGGHTSTSANSRNVQGVPGATSLGTKPGVNGLQNSNYNQSLGMGNNMFSNSYANSGNFGGSIGDVGNNFNSFSGIYD